MIPLRTLTISGCDADGSSDEFGLEGARSLADYLRGRSARLVHLHVSNNELRDEGLNILLEPLLAAWRPALEELGLTGNELQEEGADALVGAKNHLHLLEHLFLEDNDMPKREIKATYGDIINFGFEDDDEEENEDMGQVEDEVEDEDVGSLSQQFLSFFM